jgi:hypothetical protein
LRKLDRKKTGIFDRTQTPPPMEGGDPENTSFFGRYREAEYAGVPSAQCGGITFART